MWTFFFIVVAFFAGFILSSRRRQARMESIVQSAYDLGVEDGKNQVTEGRYREPAALPPPPPRSPLEESLGRLVHVVAASGLWLEETSRADWERRMDVWEGRKR